MKKITLVIISGIFTLCITSCESIEKQMTSKFVEVRQSLERDGLKQVTELDEEKSNEDNYPSTPNESEIKENIAEVASQHVTTHDIILLFGESDLFLQLLKEIKTIDCSVLYVESSILGINN